MIIKLLFCILVYFFLSFKVFAESDIDQWEDSVKTYYDLIQEGFEVKGYDINSIKTNEGYLFMFFVSVLQKENHIYECQEYQTLDENMQTLDLNFVCRKLVQPYKRGVGT